MPRQFQEIFNTVANRINSFAEVDKSNFKIDLNRGAFFEWNILWKANSIFERKNLPEFVIQCSCGRIDLVNKESFDKFHSIELSEADMAPSLKCSVCLRIEIDFNGPITISQRTSEGLEELSRMFRKAEEENYMTLCWYLWETMGIEKEQLREIYESTSLIFDQYTKNNLEVFLQNCGLGQFRLTNDYHYPRQYLLCLLTLNHIIEIDGLYDILVSLGMIAESENFLIGDDGVSIFPVGVKITKDMNDDRETVKFKIAVVKKWLRQHKYMKLAKLIQTAFNYELRNAFAHAEYKFTKTGVYLIRYKREVSYQSLQESFLGAYHLLSQLVTLVQTAREKFIQSGGYSEGGWTITPDISPKGFSVQISSSSPLPKPTGSKRSKN